MAIVKISIVVTVDGERVISSETTGDTGDIKTNPGKAGWRTQMRDRGRELTSKAMFLVPMGTAHVENVYDKTIEKAPTRRAKLSVRAATEG